MINVVSARARAAFPRQGRRESGASLLFALITLVALALAASALVRSVDTGAIVIGNLGAKKATAVVADRVTQQAVNFLANLPAANRMNDAPNQGYYATSKPDFDLTGFDRTDPNRKLVNWDIDGTCAYATSGTCDPLTRPSDKQPITDAGSGVQGHWLITRLCTTAGMTPLEEGNNCAVPLKGALLQDQNRNSPDNSNPRLPMQTATVYYRIIVRVTGPRNAATFTETIVNLTS
jgi:type IV pilus assembly protein PilX